MISYAFQRLSRIMGLDVGFFVKYFMVLGSGEIIQAAISAGVIAILARYLSKEQLGVYYFVLATLTIISFLGFSSMNTAMIKATALNKLDQIFQATGLTLISTIIGSLGLISFGIYWWLWRSEPYVAGGLMIGAIFFPLINSFNYYRSVLIAQKKIKQLAWSGLWISLGMAVTMIPTAIWLPSPWLLLCESLAIQSLVHGWFSMRLPGAWDFKRYMPRKTKLLMLGLKLSLYDGLVLVSMHADKVILGLLLPLEVLAQYSIIIMIPEFIKGILKQIENVTQGKMVAHSAIEFKKHILRHTLVLMVLITGVIGVYMKTIPWILPILFPKYGDMVVYTQVFSISLYALAFMFVNNYFRLFEKEKYVLALNLLYFVVTLGTLWILLPIYGLWGVIYSRLVTRIGVGIVSLVLLYSEDWLG